MSGFLTVKNWARFQHYKDRKPPWIKLYRDVLDDKAYLSLPVNSMALAPCIWLIASENDGKISDDPADLAFRVRRSEGFCTAAMQGLVLAGFLIGRVDTANKALAPRPQVAIPERETERERERETEKRKERFAPPSLEEVRIYVQEKKYHFDGEAFWNFYESVGWKVGNKPMKKWESACVTWETRWKTDHPELQPLARSSKCVRDNRPRAEGSMFCTACLEEIAAQARQMGAEVK